jgi:V8-like Glu-specific endopeptidase
VESLSPGVMRNAARSTGIFLEVSKGAFPKVSSCSAVLIGPDLILTAAHCVEDGNVIPNTLSGAVYLRPPDHGARLAAGWLEWRS